MIYPLFALAVVLAASTVWFLTRPLIRSVRVEAREDYYQLQLVRDRLLAQLNELDVDERDRTMETDTAVDERARLEGDLAAVLKKLETLKPESESKKDQSRSPRAWPWVMTALAVIVPSLAASLYLINATVPPTELVEVSSVPAGIPPQALKMVERLEKRLQDNPNDVEGWLKLGRSYAVLGRLEDARAVYERAYGMLPKKYEANGPEEAWFLGLAAYGQGDTPRAMVFWQKLLDSMPPDSEAAKQLRGVMDHVKNKRKKK